MNAFYKERKPYLVVLSKSLANSMYRYKNARLAWREWDPNGSGSATLEISSRNSRSRGISLAWDAADRKMDG